MDKKTQQKLEGCLLGYVTRRKLVHCVRNDYERVVSEIQAPTEKEGLPLSKEVLVWPTENKLCLPRFTLEFNEDKTLTASCCPVLSDECDDTSLSLQVDTHPECPLLTSQSSESENTNVDTAITEEAVVFPELPKSREGLLELRAQLSMELLWIKQAISSRQEYLVYKQQITSNT